MLIFRSFAVKSASGTTINIKADGYSDAPEVGQILMKAPQTATGTGQSGKVTAVVYDKANEQFVVTVDTSLGTLAANDILVEASGSAASASATVLVPNPNVFNEADRDLLPPRATDLKTPTIVFQPFTTSRLGLHVCSHYLLTFWPRIALTLTVSSGFNHKTLKKGNIDYGKRI